MEGVKIYGLCLERLRHQIVNARKKSSDAHVPGRLLLESYRTGELDDIIDILELYDVTEKTSEQVSEKLEDLAYTVSVLLREHLSFDYTSEGHLGLYLSAPAPSALPLQVIPAMAAA